MPLYFLNFFVHGCLAAFVESYLLLYVATRWPATPSWFLGALTLVAAVFEIPVFLYAGDVLRRYGVRRCLVAAQLLFVARCAAYAYVAARAGDQTRGYLWFLLLEPSHAVTFAMMWSAAVEYTFAAWIFCRWVAAAPRPRRGYSMEASPTPRLRLVGRPRRYARTAAPPELQGTAQALLRGTYYNLGIAAGSVVAGHVVDARGYEFLYKLGAVAMCGWATLWALALEAARRRRGAPDALREDLLSPGDVAEVAGIT